MFKESASESELNKIRAAGIVSVDIKATQLTKFSAKISVGKNTKIIGGENVKSGINSSQRMRTITVSMFNACEDVFKYDLDNFSDNERCTLLLAIVQDNVISSERVAETLAWISWYIDEKPAGVIDVSIAARIFKPAVAQVGLNIKANTARSEGEINAAMSCLKSSENGASLKAIAATLGIKYNMINTRYADFTIRELTQEHFDACTSSQSTVFSVLRRLLNLNDGVTINHIYSALMSNKRYAAASRVVIKLSDMHRNGMQFNIDEAVKMQEFLYNEIADAADGFICKTGGYFERFHDRLYVVNSAVKDDLKNALASYAADFNVHLYDKNNTPKIGKRAAIIAGAEIVLGWNEWERLQSCKSSFTAISEYIDLSKKDYEMATIHSLIAITCSTMRTSSRSPSVQNVSQDTRCLFTAPPGFKIISADYSQVELRIAAAAAKGTYDDAMLFKSSKRWINDVIADAKKGKLAKIPSINPRDVQGKDKISAYMQQHRYNLGRAIIDIKDRGMPLLDIFKKGIDPHLATALTICIKKGTFKNCDVIKYLENADSDEIKRLLIEYKDDRKAAKAVNFGLLYGMSDDGLWFTGMTNYGLKWTRKEAKQAAEAWFEQYPEIRFWQLWIRLTKKQGTYTLTEKAGFGQMKQVERTIWLCSTITGREIAAETITKALNYGIQGAGADFIIDAIDNINNTEMAWISNVVHDELIAVARDDTADEYASYIKEKMEKAADKYLNKYGINANVDVKIAQSW